MDKIKLYAFSLEIKKLISDMKIDEAESKIEEEHLSQAELDFLFMCLQSNGYDPQTDKFTFFESDNAAFLKLVNLVQSKVSDRK